MKQDADRAFDKYKQNLFIRHHYSISFECYMDRIIDLLAETQQTVDIDLGTYRNHNETRFIMMFQSQIMQIKIFFTLLTLTFIWVLIRPLGCQG